LPNEDLSTVPASGDCWDELHSGNPILRDVWRELDSRSAKLLVLATYTLAIALIMFHALSVSQK
jgi:hypothetical protein